MSSTPLTKLLDVYLTSDYIAFDGKREVMARIYQLSPELDALLEKRGAAEIVFVTAWNPRSVKAADSVNSAATARLKQVLDEEDLDYLPHEGRSHTGDWKERGFAIFDLPPLDALNLAEMFQQNAIVWQALGQPAHVLFTPLAVPG